MRTVPSINPMEMRKRSRTLDVEIGQAVRLNRKNAKVSLKALADRLGIAHQQVQKYETGVNRIAAGRLMEISEILGVPVANFFQGGQVGEIVDTVTDTDSALQGRQLLLLFLRITNPDKRRTVLDFVRALAESDSRQSFTEGRLSQRDSAQSPLAGNRRGTGT